MTTADDRKAMAELIFPARESGDSPSYYEEKYPPRDYLPEGAAVTRLGPSPTGFIHLGNLYTAFMNEKLADETGGVFILRIEDTDSKREVEGAARSLITALRHFGVVAGEGVMADGDEPEGGGTGGIFETGEYGPYHQSARKEIYHSCAKSLTERGLAYPCFLTESEIDGIRAEQEKNKETPGIYGKYAKYRDTRPEEARRRMDSGEGYVLRLNADNVNEAAARAGDAGEYISVRDGIRGELKMPRNVMDVVLLKSDGIPTYHFAHVVDDHFMRTTHVIRGEEWISSLPIHVAIFGALDFSLPLYCHSTVLMKMDGGGKRKLSKRKDPELSLEYYRSEGYHPKAILEYLLTVINSNFEEWRAGNPDAAIENFSMTPEKMGTSGILFDLDKLSDVSKEVLARLPAGEIADFLISWAKDYDSKAGDVMAADRVRLAKILDIGRTGGKPRKDLDYARRIWDFINYFYDDYFKIKDAPPENVAGEDVPLILKAYADSYAHGDDRDAWFGKIRALATELGYAAKPKDYKKEPDRYKGHVGDVSTVIRIALTGRATSPDLYEIQQILGEDKTLDRINKEYKNHIA